MEKLNKLTEQLENLGLLDKEGQGSIYKGRRIGEIITAVKMLNAQVQTESPKDKNYVYFQHEIARLKKVNQHPNPYITRFLNYGVSEAGRLPFVEMNFVDGPDVEEIQKTPHDAIFTIAEALKVAEHLSEALAHWHRAGVKHGNVKSRNLKFDIHTGNYILVNFGWTGSPSPGPALNDPVDTISLAPEQKKGLALFQTDVYQFGVILFKLLAGRIVIRDEEKNSSNAGIASYLQTPPLEFLALRKKNIPSSWPDDQQQQEVSVPEWLVLALYKCLEKDPENRFANGIELHSHITDQILISTCKEKGGIAGHAVQDAQLSVTEREEWKLNVEKEKHFYKILHGQWKELNESVRLKDKELEELREQVSTYPKQVGGLRRFAGNTSTLKIFLFVAVFFGLIFAYLLFSQKAYKNPDTKISSVPKPDTSKSQHPKLKDNKNFNSKPVEKSLPKNAPVTLPPAIVPSITEPGTPSEPKPLTKVKEPSVKERSPEVSIPETDNSLGRYKVKSKAYFYDEPDEVTRRSAFIIHWNNAILIPLGDRDGFVYVVFTNHLGQTSRGWLRKKDLIEL